MSVTADPFELAARRFERKGVSVYFRDPVGFADNCIAWKVGEGLADYQREILTDLNDNRRLAVRGPHGLGKTTAFAIALHWFALTRDSLKIDWKIITTAGVWRQLENFLWPEVHKWAGRLRWDAVGRGPYDSVSELQILNLKLEYGAASAVSTNNKNLIEGAHADHILYLFDEAKSIPVGIFDAAEGAFSADGVPGLEAYAMAQSTPGEPQGRFYDIHKRKPGLLDWSVRHVTHQQVIASRRMSQEWFENRKKMWGEDSAVFANRALGEFHSSDVDSVVPLSWVEAANERWHQWVDGGRVPPAGRKISGVDVARGGKDLTVIAERQGFVVMRLSEYNIADTVKVADIAISLAPNQTDLHVVDVNGVGAGVVDTMRHRRVPVIAFNAGKKNRMRDRTGEFKFANNRTAMWWLMREALDPAFSPTLALPPVDELTADLTAPKFEYRGDVVVVESKKDFKKRLGRSTDHGDAVCQTLLTDKQFDENYDPDKVAPPIPYREDAPSVGENTVHHYAERSLDDWMTR